MTINSFPPRRRRLRTITLIVLIFAAAATAADVHDYHTRVETALGLIAQLRVLDATDGDLPDQQMIADVRRIVPPTETIDLPGSTIETDNAWLHEGLEALAQFSDPEDRLAQIYALEERLTALDKHLTELREANAAATTKDETKRMIAEILRRAEFQPPQEAGESLFQRWIREFTDWLAKMFPRVPALSGPSSGAGTLRLGLQIVVFVLVIGLIGFFVYRFLPMFSFQRAKRDGDEESRIILGEHIATDTSPGDLFSEAEKMARDGDLRGAIRKGYIALLCELSDRKMVRLALHRTNRDYLGDVKGNRSLFEKLQGSTHSFERNWYGLRTVTSDEWEEFRARYRETVETAVNR